MKNEVRRMKHSSQPDRILHSSYSVPHPRDSSFLILHLIMTKAIFPGTFDPFTVGHYSVVRRALTFIDEIVIGIGINDNKNTHFPIAEREAMIRDLYKDEPRVSVQAYDSLTIDFARQVGANLIIRGIRTVKDFEYEETIADINRKLTGIETILLFTEPELSCVSSTIVRELMGYGKDVSMFLPEGMKTSHNK